MRLPKNSIEVVGATPTPADFAPLIPAAEQVLENVYAKDKLPAQVSSPQPIPTSVYIVGGGLLLILAYLLLKK